ncbi:MAG TPA: hypothetical protein DCL17_04180 [Dehalococcoidia bacterium]|nr:hypothetical protein [Dehalococcoidia bacterium]
MKTAVDHDDSITAQMQLRFSALVNYGSVSQVVCPAGEYHVVLGANIGELGIKMKLKFGFPCS